ncbi:MAG: helix-turn-helix transcriptional regulator [Clostridia bacterium]|nr:helix-turn-helix transcriptional regulator [Clostridia bacterium]
MIRITLDTALSDRNISRYELAKRTGVRYHIIDNYYKNKVIRYDSFILNKICTALNCKIEDIITFEKE